MRESEIERYFVKKCKEYKGEVRKVRWLDRKGAPDRVVFFPGGDIYWVELKRPGKKPEDHQKREHARLIRQGQQVHTIDSLHAVDRFFVVEGFDESF